MLQEIDRKLDRILELLEPPEDDLDHPDEEESTGLVARKCPTCDADWKDGDAGPEVGYLSICPSCKIGDERRTE
jgi:hypothetical protein